MNAKVRECLFACVLVPIAAVCLLVVLLPWEPDRPGLAADAGEAGRPFASLRVTEGRSG